MNVRKAIASSLLLLTFCSAWGQDATQPSTPPLMAEHPDVPTSMGLREESLSFAPELVRTNYLDGGISVGSTFDSNALNAPSNPVSNFGYSILPFLTLRQSRAQLLWHMAYAGGITLNQRLVERNQFSHDFGLHMEYDFTQHVRFHLRDHFLMTAGLFDQTNPTSGQTPAGIAEAPNQTVVTPLAKQKNNNTTAELGYQFTARSIVGISSTMYQSYYSDTLPGSNLLDTRSIGGSAYYNHRFTQRNWGGFTYRFQRMAFTPGTERTLLQSFLYTHTVYLRPGMTLEVFAGPQYARSSGQSVSGTAEVPTASNDKQKWFAAGGVTLNWNSTRTGFLADFSRSVTDGGGLIGASQLLNINAAIRRRVTMAWTLGGSGGYASNDAFSNVGSYSPYTSFKTATGSIFAERLLANNLWLRFGYARDFQRQYGAGLTPGNVSHNRSWVTISYQFSRPLGR